MLPVLNSPDALVKNWRVSMDSCLQPVPNDARTLRNGGLFWFKQHNFVITGDNQIKLGVKVYILLLNSSIYTVFQKK